MRERGAVAKAHERVHDRRRLDDDLDLLIRDAEHEMRFDQLESFVRERGGVHCDLRAHTPSRMCESLLRAHIRELVTLAAAERAAGARQDEARDLVGRPAFEALVDRRMLAVDRQDPPAAPLLRRECKLARRHEALLVCKREVDAVLERPERGMDAGKADDGVQDDVRPGPVEQGREVATDLLERRVDVVER